jgi:hypothetical protein
MMISGTSPECPPAPISSDRTGLAMESLLLPPPPLTSGTLPECPPPTPAPPTPGRTRDGIPLPLPVPCSVSFLPFIKKFIVSPMVKIIVLKSPLITLRKQY